MVSFDDVFTHQAQKKESLDIIWGDDWVKVREKTYFKWQRMP
jgi:hypothetical protein